jgi:hypothetical protein
LRRRGAAVREHQRGEQRDHANPGEVFQNR